MLNGLDLFSGIGGLALALGDWVRPVAYCENERYAQAVLLSRMRGGQLPNAPIWDDVRTLRGESLGNWIDIIYGGFPCQDISVAGVGKGLEGERSGLFIHIIRLAKEIKPAFIFLENVPAIRTRGLNVVLRELSELGYDARWTVVSAQEVGATHLRRRWFLLAYSNGQRGRKQLQSELNKPTHGTLPARQERTNNIPKPVKYCGWSSEPAIRRGDHGVPYRPHELRGLGNSVVPLQAKVAFERLMGLSK